jgi:hypothetical protein
MGETPIPRESLIHLKMIEAGRSSAPGVVFSVAASCKPIFVSARHLSDQGRGGHFSGACVAARLGICIPATYPRIGRPGLRARIFRSVSAVWSCCRWGLPCRPSYLEARCALTAPFHPYLRNCFPRRFLFCCTFRRLGSASVCTRTNLFRLDVIKHRAPRRSSRIAGPVRTFLTYWRSFPRKRARSPLKPRRTHRIRFRRKT